MKVGCDCHQPSLRNGAVCAGLNATITQESGPPVNRLPAWSRQFWAKYSPVFPITIIIAVNYYCYYYYYYLCTRMYNTGYTQKNGAVSKVNKKFISHLTRTQHTPSAAATVQVSHALLAVRFSCLLRGQFPRWRRSRKRLSLCSVLRCPDL